MLHLTQKEADLLSGTNPEETEENRIDQTSQQSKIRARNAKSLSNGKSFEELISFACNKYRDAGEACIVKTPEPFAVYSRTKEGLFMGRFTAAKAQPDFQGIVKGGKSIIFEAKYTSKDRIQQSVITETQAKILDDHEALGGLCFVAVSIDDRYFWIPWKNWRNMKAIYGHKYVKPEEVEEYEIEAEKKNPLPFLKGILSKKEDLASEQNPGNAAIQAEKIA